MSLSHAEMRELQESGLANDTWHDKQDALRARKEGWKVWGIDHRTAKPYIEEEGFPTEHRARAYIRQYKMQGRWFVKEAEESDYDYYHDGEKGFYASMSDEQFETYSEYLDSQD